MIHDASVTSYPSAPAASALPDPAPLPVPQSRPTLWSRLSGRMSDGVTWVSGLLGIVSLSAMSGVPIPAPCPCCGGMSCPNGAAIQGILGGAAALGLQFWSLVWKKKRKSV